MTREDMDCPDCGAGWPKEDDACPSCGLSFDDLEAAAEFLVSQREQNKIDNWDLR
jgi:predicted amidophosphoribosyltransferase